MVYYSDTGIGSFEWDMGVSGVILRITENQMEKRMELTWKPATIWGLGFRDCLRDTLRFGGEWKRRRKTEATIWGLGFGVMGWGFSYGELGFWPW